MQRRFPRPQRRRYLAAPFALFATVLCGCAAGCEGGSATQPDAAMVTDVSADRVPPDAPQPADAGVDVPPAHVDDGGWARPGWLPAFTNVRFATDPERMVERPVWVPCSDGRVGCRELERGQACGNPWPALTIAATHNHVVVLVCVYSLRVRPLTRPRPTNHLLMNSMVLWMRALPIEATKQRLLLRTIATSLVRFQDPLSQQEFNNVAILPGLPSVAADK